MHTLVFVNAKTDIPVARPHTNLDSVPSNYLLAEGVKAMLNDHNDNVFVEVIVHCRLLPSSFLQLIHQSTTTRIRLTKKSCQLPSFKDTTFNFRHIVEQCDGRSVGITFSGVD